MIVSKRQMTEEQRRQRTEARVGLASNVLGIAAGGAALAGAARNPALRGPTAQNAGPVTGKLVHRGGVLNGRGRTLVRAGAGAAIGLQTANLVGDLVTNRVLSREAKKGDSVAKSVEQSIVSKSSQVRVTGRGVNIEKAGKFTDKEHAWYGEQARKTRDLNRRKGQVSGAVSGATVGGLSGYSLGAIAHNAKARRYNENLWGSLIRPEDGRNIMRKPKKAVVGLITGAAGVGGAALGSVLTGRLADTRAKRVMDNPNVKYLAMSGKRELDRREKAIEKRYYDPEMDRQRRLGMYAGAGIGGGAGLIAMGASGVKPSSREVEGGRVVRGLSMPKGKKARGKLALLAAGLASTGGGIAAYKHSNSRENDPWD